MRRKKTAASRQDVNIARFELFLNVFVRCPDSKKRRRIVRV